MAAAVSGPSMPPMQGQIGMPSKLNMLSPHMGLLPMGMTWHMGSVIPVGKSQYKTVIHWVVNMYTKLLHCFIMFYYYMQHIDM